LDAKTCFGLSRLKSGIQLINLRSTYLDHNKLQRQLGQN